MAAIIGRLNSPVNEDGSRTVIYLETSVEAVVDPTTGKNLKEVLESLTYPDASSTASGLLSSENYKRLQEMYKQLMVVSKENPGRPCNWKEIVE
nr:MAG TPA: hypothetical protein [Caudoviricetes sp.]